MKYLTFVGIKTKEIMDYLYENIDRLNISFNFYYKLISKSRTGKVVTNSFPDELSRFTGRMDDEGYPCSEGDNDDFKDVYRWINTCRESESLYEACLTKETWINKIEIEESNDNNLNLHIHVFEGDKLIEELPEKYMDVERWTRAINTSYWSSKYAREKKAYEMPDRLFSYYVYCHGISAYAGFADEKKLIERVSNLFANPEWEICCSDKTQPIGPIGVYVKGCVKIASNIDLASYIDDSGKRRFNTESFRAKGIIHSPLELNSSKWDHNEFIVGDYEVVGFWIKEWAMNDPKMSYVWEILKEKYPNKIFHARKGRK